MSGSETNPSDKNPSFEFTVSISTFTDTITFVTNQSIKLLVNYVNNRGLDIEGISRSRESIERGLWAWFAGGHIESLALEVYDNNSGELIERFDLQYDYTEPGKIEEIGKESVQRPIFEDYMSEMGEVLDRYEEPPEGAKYRILVSLKQNETGKKPPSVEGWSSTSPKNYDDLEVHHLGDSISTVSQLADTRELWLSTDNPQRETKQNNTVAETLIATPHTFLQFPKNQTEAYFYHFTDEMYTQSDSKYRLLDERLTIFGRYRSGVKVISIDRDRTPDLLWDIIVDGLNISDYPALVVAESSLGIEDLTHDTEEYSPNDATFAKIERGIIVDHILNDPDQLNSFLNELFDGARRSKVQRTMTQQKITDMLTIGRDQVEQILTIQP